MWHRSFVRFVFVVINFRVVFFLQKAEVDRSYNCLHAQRSRNNFGQTLRFMFVKRKLNNFTLGQNTSADIMLGHTNVSHEEM